MIPLIQSYAQTNTLPALFLLFFTDGCMCILISSMVCSLVRCGVARRPVIFRWNAPTHGNSAHSLAHIKPTLALWCYCILGLLILAMVAVGWYNDILIFFFFFRETLDTYSNANTRTNLLRIKGKSLQTRKKL